MDLSSVRRNRWALLAFSAAALVSAASAPAASAATPVKIGVSVALSGDFSGDGKAILQGYRLWQTDVNKAGGLLGHPVQLVVMNDDSSTQQTLTNYSTLIGTDHVNMVFGPFSSLLTIPAVQIARRYGYLLLGPAGGAPAVFAEKYDGYAFVQPAAVVSNLMSFAGLMQSLPPGKRPKTVAYATSNDPFTEPQLPPLKAALTKLGMKSVYFQVFPDETPDLSPEALAIVRLHPDVVVLGTTAVPQVQGFVQTFIQQHYTPKIIIATSGPDQGSAFSSAIGMADTQDFLVPEGWTPGAKTYENARFVKEYLAKFGGTAAAISGDAPEAYSVGQILQQLVQKTHSLQNATLIAALHDTTFHTVQGPMRFGPGGSPVGAGTFLVQWHSGSTAIVWPAAIRQAPFDFPKPAWN